MKKHINYKVGLLLLSCFYLNAANAATFDFNANNLGVSAGSTHDSVGMTVDGINVNVEAYTIENDGSGNITSQTLLGGSGTGVYVSSTSSGNLGVTSNLSGDGRSLDGGDTMNDQDEGLLFTFDFVVNLDYVNFDSFGSLGDDFNLTVDGILVLLDFNSFDSSPLVTNVLGEPDEFNFQNIQGREFLFWADGDSDRFRIDTIQVSPVPLPAAIWFMGSGLLGMLGLSRRKNQVAM